MRAVVVGLFVLVVSGVIVRAEQPFDGSKWNISTGNLSVGYIQASPIGAHPRKGVMEPPPSVEELRRMKQASLVAYEDYFAWGAEEREQGKWDWTQHDAMEKAVHAAGLKYVAYNWIHFPPLWLREGQTSKQRTLMKCLEHGKETNYLSIFDPKTIENYDHFYKHLAEHFGEKLDGVYACILGPYGEGNYPLNVPDWVNIGHCHEGFWCADDFAALAFCGAMEKKYQSVEKLNEAWGTTFRSFKDVSMPTAIDEKFRPSAKLWKTGTDRRRWLDFITWYHQAIIDFAEKSIRVTLKYFPKDKVRTKPGGNAGGVNPLAWGTYCPGYAKMAAKFGIPLQPADCQGAYCGDKWVATAYHFYKVPLGTEPAGGLDHSAFNRRMFSDASCGASQIFTYEFDEHAEAIRKYAHLVTGEMGETDVAVLCPTTLYRLGGDLLKTIDSAMKLRDVADYDVLDELLIADGALTPRYKALVIFEPSFMERDVLEKIVHWANAGGKLLMPADASGLSDVEGMKLIRPPAVGLDLKSDRWLATAAAALADMRGVDGRADGLWTTRRGSKTFIYNTQGKERQTDVVVNGVKTTATVRGHEIWETP
ncbi:MAG TPA: family 14 glycosylhydrolase [Tepidisphaeraceae bacterium]|jgi:hypothetical protein